MSRWRWRLYMIVPLSAASTAFRAAFRAILSDNGQEAVDLACSAIRLGGTARAYGLNLAVTDALRAAFVALAASAGDVLTWTVANTTFDGYTDGDLIVTDTGHGTVGQRWTWPDAIAAAGFLLDDSPDLTSAAVDWAAALDWYAPVEGDNTAALQAAIDTHSGGLWIPPSTIRVDGQITLPSHFTLAGAGDESVLWMSNRDPYAPGNLISIPAETTHVRVTGIRFRGDYDASTAPAIPERTGNAILFGVTGCADCIIERCYFTGLYGFSVHAAGTGQRLHVIDCWMQDTGNGCNVNADHSIQTGNTLIRAEGFESGASYITIHGNTIRECLVGVSAGGTTSPGDWCDGVAVYNNDIAAVARGIIVAHGCRGAHVHHNRIANVGSIGIMTHPVDAYNPVLDTLVEDNVIEIVGGFDGNAAIGVFNQGDMTMIVRRTTAARRSGATNNILATICYASTLFEDCDLRGVRYDAELMRAQATVFRRTPITANRISIIGAATYTIE